MMGAFLLLVVLALVLANAFFVAAEFALVSIRRSRVDELVAAGSRAAAAVRHALDDLDGYIAGTQVGITLASLGLGWVGEPALAHLIAPAVDWIPGLGGPVAAHGIAVGVAFACITFLHVVLGELVPKSIALQRTEATALGLAWPLRWVVFALRPLIWSLNGVGNLALRRMGLQAGSAHRSVHSVDELAILAGQSRAAGVLDSQEHELVTRGLHFGERLAREAMVPRPDVVALDIAEPVAELLGQAVASRHTRLPVYEGSRDHIIGVLNVRQLLPPLAAGAPPTDLRPLLSPPVFVPDVASVDQALQRLRQDGSEMAVVVDELGGTAGILTLRDVIEEVFGPLDAAEDPVRRGPDGVLRVRGSARLDEVNRALGWTLVDPAAETIGGYVVSRLGRAASVGDTCAVPGATLRVDRVGRLRVAWLAVLPSGPVGGDAVGR